MGSVAAIVGIIAAVATVASTVMQAQAAGAQAKAARRQAQEQERVAESETAAAEMEAVSTREAAFFEEQQSRRRSALLLGRQRARTAASGLAVTSGSPLLLELDSIRQAEIEALTIRRSGESVAEARFLAGRVRASQARFQAGMSRLQARAIRRQIPGILIGGGLQAAAGGFTTFREAGGTFSGPAPSPPVVG